MKDPTALLVIDVQLGMFNEAEPVYGAEALLATLRGLIDRAHAAGAPVIYIQHCGLGEHPIRPGQPGWPIHPRIAPAEGDTVVHKNHPDSFQDTNLQATLEAAGIRNLVLCGIQTEYCVDTTCRRAYSLGYDVTLVQDGHTTWDNQSIPATQIIAHTNETLGGWFARITAADQIQFN